MVSDPSAISYNHRAAIRSAPGGAEVVGAPRLRTPVMRRRMPLYQKVRDRSILIALSARTMMANVS